MLEKDLIQKSEECISLLKAANKKISTSESCTGGLLSAYLTSVPGSSMVFDCSFITYSNESKIELLGVSKHDIIKFGAVSSEVALSMARGALRKSSADLALGITGIAGPDTEDNKPIGLVYIAFIFNEITNSYKYNFPGDRAQVRISTVFAALKIIKQLLIN